jgi:3-polyprenyl-4-hydroxybenzoate decarboxylase
MVLAEIISSTLKREAICSSETSVATQQTTRRHIPEDDTLHNHRCENLKSYNDDDEDVEVTSASYQILFDSTVILPCVVVYSK